MVEGRYWRTTYKFGVRVPKSVQDTFRIDSYTGTTFCTDLILKEMKKVIVAFELIDGFTTEEMRNRKCDMLKGLQEIGCHMILDVKTTLTRKARLVARGHTTFAQSSITYSSVVSRESIRIDFLIAGLNELKVSVCDIGNAYLNEKCQERIWSISRTDFPP